MNDGQNQRLRYLLLLALIALIYAQSVGFDYALDDAIFITKNERVQAGLGQPFGLFENAKSGKLGDLTGYRPITLLSFAAEVHFFGLNPTISHLVNVLLYAVLCLLLLRFLERCFSKNPWISFFVVLLFAVHPLHVEVVANIKGRDEILALLFGVLFLQTLVNYLITGKHAQLFLAPVWFLLASLSKESAITMAGAGMGVLMLRNSDWVGRKVVALLTSIVAVGCVLLMRLYVYSDAFFKDGTSKLENMGAYHWDGFLGNPLFDVESPAILVANALNILFFSVKKFLVPYPLVHDYSFNHFPVADWSDPTVYAGLFLVLLSAILIYRFRLKNGQVVMGVLWFGATISVYLSLVRPATDIFAERFLFTPSFGLGMLAIGLMSELKIEKKTARTLGAVVVCAFSFLSFSRVPDWKDTKTLMEADIYNLNDCVRANYNYALLLHQEYNNSVRNQSVEKQSLILKHYERALLMSDRLANLYLALGNAYMEFGDKGNGLRVYKEGAEKYPHLTKTLIQIGRHYESQNMNDSAHVYFKKAAQVGIADEENHLRLAIVQYKLGLGDLAAYTLVKGEKYATTPNYYHKFVALCAKLDSIPLMDEVVTNGLERFPNDWKLKDYRQQLDGTKPK